MTLLVAAVTVSRNSGDSARAKEARADVVERDSSAPRVEKWDRRIAPIAADVEDLRGLTFKHPVPVRFLPELEFEDQVGMDADDDDSVSDAELMTEIWRAVGLIGDDVDLFDAVDDASRSGILAYYDHERDEIVVRGDGPIDAHKRVTLAHELTHALQDQHFDLDKLQEKAWDVSSEANDTLRALIEGDAERIEHQYLDELSPADAADYDRIDAEEGDRIVTDTTDVPAALEILMYAPYMYGPGIARILEAEGGNAAVDEAFTRSAPSAKIYFDPLSREPAKRPANPPRLRQGEREVEDEDLDAAFDAFSLYLMLAGRLDLRTAIAAADAMEHGTGIVYEAAGTTCFRATIAGDSELGTAVLADAIDRWTVTMPNAAVEDADGVVTFHACDPGAAASPPNEDALQAAARLLAFRSQLVEELVRDQLPADMASCVAHFVVGEEPVMQRIVDNELDTAAAAEDVYVAATASRAACGPSI
jgi:hypothetical protein